MALVISMRRAARFRVAAFAGILLIIFIFSPYSPRPSTFRSSHDDTTKFNDQKWFFEEELPVEWYPRPKYNIDKLKVYASHNYKGPGYPTFATYFASRDGTLQDPYFLATQQLTYRLLWDPRSRSKYPFTVFVAPFISQEQRDILAAAGAIVREMPLVPFEPKTDGQVAGRLRDMFSKLSMWNMTDFTKIAYLDADAFPLKNIDGIFDEAPKLRCKKEVPKEDKGACSYILGATYENEDGLNAGVLVLKPNVDMYNRLMRESHNTSNFDQGMMEQAFLSYAFSQKGPFPASTLSPSWNAALDAPDKGIDVYILHGKLWAMFWDKDAWCSSFFNDTWRDMLTLYESPRFEQMRAENKLAELLRAEWS